ncbi:PTS cellobiose transporter subunit IIC [Streptococcus azizii]|uniref:Permease IIC component n=1 Tax=Streptococcus azizii TaxID=1579424 RepID=A0AB36JNE8_9STRE|nr:MULTISPECIES: PTS sugar transporter subunit IIC [Streptococcus]ONK25478.1 PTS cellobiose transporter subunit IIC [Streptococcus azizii]ONK25669.1 PTS cellobiose transporter subunit IIC [Streptococcus azizii]ONK28393.1 PTS cellobiose transporter subunit IIC [Streptococcus azizii]
MDTFMKISGKLGSQKHLVAIRDAFLAMFPLTMAGAIAVLINVLVRDIPNSMGNKGFAEAMQPLITLNGSVYFGTIAIMALAFVFALGYNRAQHEKINPIAGGLVSFAAFISTIPQTITIMTDLAGLDKSVIKALVDFGLTVSEKGLETSEWGTIKVAYAGATGLFTAMIIGLLSAEIYCFLMKKKVTIKMPDTVPPAVNKAFASMIPGIVAIYVSAFIGFIAVQLSGQSLNDLVSTYIQTPLLGLSQGWFSVVLLSFLVQLFWFFGLHGHNVLGPVLDGIYLPALLENTAAHEAGKTLPYIWTRGSFDAYGQMGGSGVTIAFIIAVFLFSKRQEYRAVAKLSAPMGVFNINEPVTFGIPMVLNPLFVIPWLIVPPICCGIAYAATALGLIPPVYVAIPWITPPGLYAFLATGGNVLAGLVSLFNVFVAFLIWTPFVVAANKVEVE